MDDSQNSTRHLTWAAVLCLALLGLFLTRLHSYLLFHTLGEFFSITVAIAIFLLVWNMRQSLDNSYLLFLGLAYAYVAGLDFLHTIAYKGMGIFDKNQENLATQLWIAARYLQSISLLVAPLVLGRKLNVRIILSAYTAVFALLVLSIFYWRVFPVCYVSGVGLTPFKRTSEYLIGLLLLAALGLLVRRRDRFDPLVFMLMALSIGLTIVSELFFSSYVTVDGFTNVLGHIFKIAAFYCIYKAIIERGMAKPLAVLFRSLKESEGALRAERDFIHGVLAAEDAMVAVLDREGRIVRFNKACERLTGHRLEEIRGQRFWDVLSSDERDASDARFDEMISSPDYESHEIAVTTKDGRSLCLLLSASVIHGPEGELEHVVVSGVDITARRQAEDQLKLAHDKLEQRVAERTAELVQTNRQLVLQIEERHRAEAQREAERSKLQSILENMQDGVYIASQNYDILYANPVLEREFGPVNGRKCYEYLDGRRQVCPGCRSPEIFAGKTLQWEWRSAKTGKAYEIFDAPVMQADGTVARLEILHDITFRKQAEDALRESATKYRTVADNTYDWEWWLDPGRRFVYVSPSCLEITQHRHEEFLTHPDLLFQLVHPDDRTEFRKHIADVEEKGFSGEIEFRILRPDGAVRWIAHACLPVHDEQGRFLGRRGSNRDITRRKEAEKALQKSEEHYRALVETMNEGFAIVNENEIWTYANEKLCDMLGYRCEELLGRPVQYWLDDANRAVLQEQLELRRQGETKPYELSWLRKDGSILHTMVSPRPIKGEDGSFQGSFAVVTDITEQKKSEQAMLQALAEIRALKDRLEAENIYFRQEMKAIQQFDQIIGESNAIKYVLFRAEQVAPTNSTVLIQGETGTGKELVAAAIHRMSLRKDRPLITVNCAALPANLIESELFGREKGAFTGADARREGRFEIADGSTLCLDEIGEMPLDVQAKLLRVIQHGEFERLGSSRTVRVDVRILATTNRNLEEEVKKGRFRQDLFYRLNVVPITVPPLRQRKEDIPLLVQAFAERFGRQIGKEFTSIHPETMRALQEYDWPGNIRELENVIERAVILGSGTVLQLSEKLQTEVRAAEGSLKTLEQVEREQILKTLAATDWRINGKTGAAAILGLNPSTLRAKMHKLGIRRPQIARPD